MHASPKSGEALRGTTTGGQKLRKESPIFWVQDCNCCVFAVLQQGRYINLLNFVLAVRSSICKVEI